jgi:hypothetical protein
MRQVAGFDADRRCCIDCGGGGGGGGGGAGEGGKDQQGKLCFSHGDLFGKKYFT